MGSHPPHHISITQMLNDNEEAMVVVGIWKSPRHTRWVAMYNVDFLGERVALVQARRLADVIAAGKMLEIKDDTL